jgi:AcrR family transcriptional regulator
MIQSESDGGTLALPPLPKVTPRRRTARALANDATLRTAAAELAVEVGWDEVRFAGVAKRAGLSVAAVHSRAENKAELGSQVWESLLGDHFAASVDQLVATVHAGDLSETADQLSQFSDPTPMLQASCELLLAALFDDDLAEVVGPSARATLARHCSPGRTLPPATAGANALIIGSGLGRTMAAAAGMPSPVPAEFSAALLGAMAAAQGRGRRLPAGPPIQWVKPFTLADPHREALSIASLDLISRVGYRRTTVARICRAAGVSSGSLFARFVRKADLVAEAAEELLTSTDEMMSQFAAAAGKQSGPILDALIMRGYLEPAHLRHRALRLELARIAPREPAIAALDLLRTTHQQVTMGLSLLAAFLPELSGLPFIVALEAAGTVGGHPGIITLPDVVKEPVTT